MGCSSGNQYVMGDFEPYGTILAYIIAGCPCVVGNLWDVTDRDIDRLTEEFLTIMAQFRLFRLIVVVKSANNNKQQQQHLCSSNKSS